MSWSPDSALTHECGLVAHRYADRRLVAHEGRGTITGLRRGCGTSGSAPVAHGRAGGGVPSTATYSNTGYWVDFSVPADGVVSTYVQGVRRVDTLGSAGIEEIECGEAYAAWSGTSFAAPQVTGLLAALRSEGYSASQALPEHKRQSVKANDVGRILRSLEISAGQADA